MKTPTEPPPVFSRTAMNRQVLVCSLVAFGLVLIVGLELIFAYFDISANGRPLTLFDLQVAVVTLLLLTSDERLLFYTYRLDFYRLPILYRIYFGIAVYILIIKATYFLAFLFAFLFR